MEVTVEAVSLFCDASIVGSRQVGHMQWRSLAWWRHNSHAHGAHFPLHIIRNIFLRVAARRDVIVLDARASEAKSSRSTLDLESNDAKLHLDPAACSTAAQLLIHHTFPLN